MHGVDRGKNWRLFQKFTYRYSPGRLSIKQMPFLKIEWAKHKNLHGLMLETQDNNLIACKFYHNCGFKIGSVDTMLYANFENNFEKAVFWYLRF